MVQFDADRLECPFCRMSALCADLCRDRTADDLRELEPLLGKYIVYIELLVSRV